MIYRMIDVFTTFPPGVWEPQQAGAELSQTKKAKLHTAFLPQSAGFTGTPHAQHAPASHQF